MALGALCILLPDGMPSIIACYRLYPPFDDLDARIEKSMGRGYGKLCTGASTTRIGESHTCRRSHLQPAQHCVPNVPGTYQVTHREEYLPAP
jgi:hypothetical protein